MAAAKKAKPKSSASQAGPAKPKAAARRSQPAAAKATKADTAAKRPKAARAKPIAKASGNASPAQPKPKSAPKARAGSKSQSAADIYTDPQLRDRLKEEITAGDKGGKPGQWSARKAQLLAHEYEKAGGGYKDDGPKKPQQQHLDQWTDEDWQTADGQPAEREGGTTRYLPKAAWDKLTPAQKKATNAKKQSGSHEGKQFVANTDAAKTARKDASDDDHAPAKQQTPPSTSAKKAKARPRPSTSTAQKTVAEGKQRAPSKTKAAPKKRKVPKDD